MNTHVTHPLPQKKPVINSNAQGRIAVRISQTESGKSYTFVVSRGEVQVYQGVAPRPATLDTEKSWLTGLNEFEKLNVAKAILEAYRLRSRDPDGTQVASLLLTETNNLYIAVNGRLVPQNNKRQCAEQSAITHADAMETEKADEAGLPRPEFKVREVYVLGANPERGLHIMGPCGDCTDLLSKSMAEDGHVWVLPLTPNKLVPIHEGAMNINEVPAGAAWKTTIGFLNRSRHVTLTPKDRVHTANGLANLIPDLRYYLSRSIVEDPNLAVHGVPSDAISPLSTDETPLSLPFDGGIAAEFDKRPARMDIDLPKLNHFMREQILFTMADRIKEVAKKLKLGDPTKMDDAALKTLVDEHIRWVRCSVIQRDDGKLFAAAKAKSTFTKASDTTETNAFGAGERRAGTQKLRKVFTMEFHPEMAEQGIMRTSAKSAVGSLIKQASERTRSVDFIYIPYNDGTLNKFQLAEAMYHFGPADLLPTLHTGVQAEVAKPSPNMVEGPKGPLDHAQRDGTAPRQRS